MFGKVESPHRPNRKRHMETNTEKALAVLDDFLRLFPDRQTFSRTEVMNLALDMRAVLKEPDPELEPA